MPMVPLTPDELRASPPTGEPANERATPIAAGPARHRSRTAARSTPALTRYLGDAAPALWGALSTVDHKIIGRRYIVTAFVFLALGGVLAAADAAAAGAAGSAAARPRPLQSDLHHARREHDVPVRRAGDGGDGGLSRAADGRHAQHRLPAAQRVLLLDLSRRRHPALDRLRARHGTGCRLVRLCAAVRARNMAPASAPTSGRR